MSTIRHTRPLWIDGATFENDVAYLESLWRRVPIGSLDLPLIDLGSGPSVPLVFVPILEHLEFVYARQVRAFSQQRRVLLYRRYETRSFPIGRSERVEELRSVLDSRGVQRADLLGHGDAAMVLFEFALRYPQRCRSLIIVAQAADYEIAPHPLTWFLHELYLRFPFEYVLPAALLRRIVINYITAHSPRNSTVPRLHRARIEEQFAKIALWPFLYKYSVLPIIHDFDIRERIGCLTMPVLLINRADDVLAPEAKTRWLAHQLPENAGYHVIDGGERFFMYAQAELVNRLIETFLATQDSTPRPSQASRGAGFPGLPGFPRPPQATGENS